MLSPARNRGLPRLNAISLSSGDQAGMSTSPVLGTMRGLSPRGPVMTRTPDPIFPHAIRSPALDHEQPASESRPGTGVEIPPNAGTMWLPPWVEYRICDPSGLHRGQSAKPPLSVSAIARPPDSCLTKILDLCHEPAEYATTRPSGEIAGCTSSP